MSNHKNHLTQLLLIKSIKHLSQQARLFSKCNGVYNRSQRWHSSGLKYMFNMVLHLQLLHSSKYSFNTGASVCSQRLLLRQGAVCQFRVQAHREKNKPPKAPGHHTVQECKPAHFKQWYYWLEKRENVTVRLSHNELNKRFFTPWSFTLSKAAGKTKTKRACNTKSTQDMTTYYFFNIYILPVFKQPHNFSINKLLPKLP